MKIYGLKNCDSCRKARKALEAELQDVREMPLTQQQLETFHAAFGDTLVNKRSTTWRTLDESEKAKEALTLLRLYPALMKRPVIDQNGTLFLGWGKDVQAALLK